MGASGTGMTLSRRDNYKTFEQIKEENIGTSDKVYIYFIIIIHNSTFIN
jgi:hypothetical protein